MFNQEESQTYGEEELDILRGLWVSEQAALLNKLVTNDVEEWQTKRVLNLVGGLDLSFSKIDPSLAVCTLVICDLKDHMKIVYEDSVWLKLNIPYIPGFLAFREVKPCQHLYKKLIISHPHLKPQVILFDGNGILHRRGLGLASHFGTLEDVCTIGVAKNLFQMDSLLRDDEHKVKINCLERVGDYFNLHLNGIQNILGVALKTSTSAIRPVYISVGHKISLDTAIWAVLQCVSEYRIPEPIRQADIRSRKEIARGAINDVMEFSGREEIT